MIVTYRRPFILADWQREDIVRPLAKQGGRYRRSQMPRPTAAQLVLAVGDDQAELIRQLRRFGYLR